MQALILDGSHAGDATGTRVRAALESALLARGWEAQHVLLREKKIGNCAGDFFCWVRTPGVCITNDENRDIAAAVVAGDLLVYLTPVTFGGYSSALKRMVDHQIQNISPFFAKVAGETHHQRRYDRYPDYLAAGWLPQADAHEEAIFRHLVHRNTLNFYARAAACGVVTAEHSEAELLTQAGQWLDAIARGRDSRARDDAAPTLPAASVAPAGGAPVRRALLLVGSPRTSKSTSHALGTYLLSGLAARGVETEILQVYTSLNSPERMRALLEKLDAADLTVLAFPLYVDSLPAPVISLLERIAAHRAGRPAHTRFAAIANCGFPEASHNATALAICARFAGQCGFAWAGGLSLGAGEMIHGTPLAEMGGPAIPIKRALELAAEALAQGNPIPQAAADLLAKPAIPPWLYRLLGGYGWRQQAQKWGAEKSLKRQAYAA